MSIEIRSQRVARAAFDQIEIQSHDTRDKQDKYLSFAKAFPALIHTSGLAQATAFALAKKKHHEQVLDDLAAIIGENGATTAGKFHECVRGADWTNYIRLTRDALFAATWLKRYAEAVLKTADSNDSTSDDPQAETGGLIEGGGKHD